ncbi:hypothetical protein [Psychrobacillus sp. FSL K6-1464]|uniref:hypothetical protein n=1 Tax=Psychrobacillus sp. FSL K6-1464 TaxID=2921545 RepID=UPI0030F5B383
MELKEAKEILRAGFAWANWTKEQKEAIELAYEAMEKVEMLTEAKGKLEKLEQLPYVRIVIFLEQRGYNYTVAEVLTGYQHSKSGIYVSHTMKDCLKNLEPEIKKLLSA